jgi:hypothetical protein
MEIFQAAKEELEILSASARPRKRKGSYSHDTEVTRSNHRLRS